MANSTSNTAYGIINDAMFDAGYLQEGAEADSEQLSIYMRRLCDIINLWQTQGIKLFLQEEITVPLVLNQTQYVIGPIGPAVTMDKPLQVLQGFVLNTSNIRRPLVPISRDEWERLSQVTGNSGTINSYFADKQSYALNLNLWPAPDSTEVLNTATFLMRVQAKNPILLTDNTAFPQEWRMALRWGLADDICTGQPESIMSRCQQRATAYRTALENFDVEDTSTRFNVDSRFYNTAGRFR